MTPYQTLEEYAEHVRLVTSVTLGALCGRFGPQHPVTLAIADLCTEAALLVNQSQMQEETADPDRYDLSKLPPVFSPRDGAASPFDGE